LASQLPDADVRLCRMGRNPYRERTRCTRHHHALCRVCHRAYLYGTQGLRFLPVSPRPDARRKVGLAATLR